MNEIMKGNEKRGEARGFGLCQKGVSVQGKTPLKKGAIATKLGTAPAKTGRKGNQS